MNGGQRLKDRLLLTYNNTMNGGQTGKNTIERSLKDQNNIEWMTTAKNSVERSLKDWNQIEQRQHDNAIDLQQ